uniref:Pyruvate kinase, cytosolic isozyme n=1 Tax=Cajanus cajan TaxID=3821 RepID=A0A151RZ34_CAJCA|nr:Pyruvate kinase, cytosolic isozyme [Cajanus cajan]
METYPTPMSSLESMASLVVRTTNCINVTLILVPIRNGTTSKLVAKYQPYMSILFMVVPEITTYSFEWFYNEETPTMRFGHRFKNESTKETIEFAFAYAKKNELCKHRDCCSTTPS